MLNYLIILWFLIFSFGCTRPTTRTYESNDGQSGTVEIIYTTESGDRTSDSNSGDTSTVQVQDENGTVSDFAESLANNPDIANCTWSTDGVSNFVYSHESIGSYNLCYVSAKNKAYIQVASPKSSSPICLFPTTNYDSGGSTYIGDASCNNVTSSTTIYPIQFYKNRTGYESYNITGSMIMYDIGHQFGYPYYGYYQIPDAYLICMQALYSSLIYSSIPDTTWCDTFSAEAQYVYHLFN